jgi:DNA-binding NtrC family response regulator
MDQSWNGIRESFPLLLEWLQASRGSELIHCGLWMAVDRLRRDEDGDDGSPGPAPDSEEALQLQVLRALGAGRAEVLDLYLDSLDDMPEDMRPAMARALARWRETLELPLAKALDTLLEDVEPGRDALLRGWAECRGLVDRGRTREALDCIAGVEREARRRGSLRMATLLGELALQVAETRSMRRMVSEAGRDSRREACWLACHRVGRMVGRSRPFRDMVAELEAAAADRLPVLLTGETGTGKELAVEYLHQRTFPAGGPLVAVNCAGLSESLAEAELFGSVRGAFTGAVEREGLATRADGGLLFLDEFGALPPPVQAKLLRFLEGGVFRPVGEVRERRVRVRVVAATCETARLRSAFRQDLLHRVAGRVVEVPPLDRRLDDLPLLTRAFLEEAGVACPSRHPLAQECAQRLLRRMEWPGNIRQMRHMVLRLAGLDRDRVLRELESARGGPPASRLAVPLLPPDDSRHPGNPLPDPGSLPLREAIACFEWQRIQQELAHCGQDKRLAARRLGISLPTLYARLKRDRVPGRWPAGNVLQTEQSPEIPCSPSASILP